MNITVVGAGAIGGFIAAALARSGHENAVVARGEHLRAMQERGEIRVAASDLGGFAAPVRAAASLDDLPHADALLLTFKAHQWPQLLGQIERAVARGAFIVTLQNGMPFWYSPQRALQAVDPAGRIRRAIPYEQIIGGVVHVSGHIVEPGVIHQSGGMLYLLGEVQAEDSPRVRELARILSCAGLDARVEPVIRRNIWRKVINNAALNPVSALTRATMHRMLRDEGVRALLRNLLREGIDVAKASGVDPQADPDERLTWADHLKDVKTSMLQDVEAGKPLELEPICGAVVELAHVYDVPVPSLEAVYALTKLLERTAARD